MRGKPQNTHTQVGHSVRCSSCLQFQSALPALCSRVFTSRLRDNYTQWGGSGVGAKGVESSKREATSARASGLKVAAAGKAEKGRGGQEETEVRRNGWRR